MNTKTPTKSRAPRRTTTTKRQSVTKLSRWTILFSDRKLASLLVVIMVGLAGSAATFLSHADTTTKTMFVFGDSITARYNNTAGSSNQGWWSMAAAKINLTPVTSAISGTGFIRKGYDCTAPNYGGRLANATVKKQVANAKIVVIEGGRNDYHMCLADKSSAYTDKATVDDWSRRFFDGVKRNHPDTSSIYVLTPWGPALSQYNWIVPIVKQQAIAHGFHWVDTTGVLTASNTVDGTHPNLQGNKDLANALLGHSNIATRAKQ